MSKDTVEKQPVDSIEDEILSVIDSANDEVKDDEIEKKQPDDAEAESSEDEDADDMGSQEENQRGDKDTPEDGGTDSEGDGDDGGKDDSGDESEAVSTSDELDPPEHWAEAHKETFKNVPKEAQEFILERHKSMEGDYTRKMQEIAPVKRQFDAIQDALSPYQQEFAQAGLDQAGAVRQLASWHEALRTNGKAAVMQLANTYGIDMTEDDQEIIDPALQSVKQQLAELKTHTTRQAQAAQQEKQQQLSQVIHEFVSEKDESGNLKHPHFETVKDDITRLFQAGIVDNLNDGYSMALSRRPDLAAPAEPVKVPEAKPDQAEKVKKAKKAATGVKSSGAVGKKNREAMSLEQEIASHIQ